MKVEIIATGVQQVVYIRYNVAFEPVDCAWRRVFGLVHRIFNRVAQRRCRPGRIQAEIAGWKIQLFL